MVTIEYKLHGSETIWDLTISNMNSVDSDGDRMKAEGCAARRHGVSLYDVTFVDIKK